jgi:uncharacterized membrane protein YqjE
MNMLQIIIAVILILAVAGSIWYLRRRNKVQRNTIVERYEEMDDEYTSNESCEDDRNSIK